MTLDKMADADSEAADRRQVRGGPVDHKAGPEQRPSEPPVGESGTDKQDSCDQVEGTETSHGLDDALLRAAHEDAGMDEGDDHVPTPKANPPAPNAVGMARAIRRNPLIPTRRSRRTPSSRGGTALVSQA